MLRRIRIFGLVTIVLLSACSGGGPSVTAPASHGTQTSSGPLTAGSLTMVIGTKTGTAGTKTRKPLFISPNSSSLGIIVNTSAETYADVSSASPNCTTLSNVRTCTIPVTAPAGSPTILLALYDGPNGTGNQLAQGSVEPTVVAGTPWTASATMAPVVAALSGGSLVYASGISFVVGTPGTATATIFADDPDGTLIPSTTPSFASPVTLTSSDPHITITPLWTGPASAITVTYDGSASVASTVTITFAKSTATLAQIPFSLTSFTIMEFPLLTLSAEPVGINSGPDGALWFVEQTGNNVGRVTTTGTVTEYPIPTANSAPTSLVKGSDGNLWFTEENTSANRIGSINPGTHVVTEYTAGISPFVLPYNITSNPDGNLYFTEYDGNKIARITTSGVVTEFTIPTANTFPSYIVSGSDGALYFTQPGTNQIGRMTTAGVFTETTIPTASSSPSGIAAGPDGAIWFLEESVAANKVGRMTTGGVVTNEFTIPTPNSAPMTIVTGADGNLWFTENANSANKVARMTTAGGFTEFPVPTLNSGPCSIALGPDNAIWFAENNPAGNKIGRI